MGAQVDRPNGDVVRLPECRVLYERAIAMIGRGEHDAAADVLRMLALASPGEPAVWNALADCHDAQERPDVGQALRALGRILHEELRTRSRS